MLLWSPVYQLLISKRFYRIGACVPVPLHSTEQPSTHSEKPYRLVEQNVPRGAAMNNAFAHAGKRTQHPHHGFGAGKSAIYPVDYSRK